MSEPFGNRHAHGRWIGLFKLGEECGEAAVAAIDLIEIGGSAVDLPEFVRALENELADVGAACRHVIEANKLDLDRIAARRLRRGEQLARGVDTRGTWIGLLALVRACSAAGQLLNKISAFPDGTEHPDGAGNLVGRLEVVVSDLGAAAKLVAERNGLDLDHIELRGDDKLSLFRIWFPAPLAEEEPA